MFNFMVDGLAAMLSKANDAGQIQVVVQDLIAVGSGASEICG
jgi:hypothetical protein